jgi:hypothetical protein
MLRLIVINHLALDGVLQAPGRPDGDHRDRFEYSGWSPRYGDHVMRVAFRKMAESGWLRIGRRTHEDLLSKWNTQQPVQGCVERHARVCRLADAAQAAAVAELHAAQGRCARRRNRSKREPATTRIMGAENSSRRLMPRNLIDEYMLLMHPLVLGGLDRSALRRRPQMPGGG